MRDQRCRRGVLQLGGGDVAGGFASGLGDLQQRRLILAVHVHAERAVIGFHPGGPGGGGGGGVGHVVRLVGFPVQRVMGVLSGQRQGVDALEVTACAFGVVARGGDLGIPHAVADQQDHVFRRFVRQRRLQRVGLIAGQTAGAARFDEVAARGAIGQAIGIGRGFHRDGGGTEQGGQYGAGDQGYSRLHGVSSLS
ncbi:Uncharacterised protein [Acinetobacter baumannii]|nr:Uncharacterised protein [Acinetobacter baumannii]